MANKRLTPRDYEFMNSLSSAVLETTPIRLRYVLFFWVIAVSGLFIWAYFANIDEIVRGEGEIIPSGKNQVVQNLEGGIVEEILVKVGEDVEKDQILVKINNQRSETSLSSNAIKIDSIKAKLARLKAQAGEQNYIVDESLRRKIPFIVKNEESLYKSNKRELDSKIDTSKERLAQREQELIEASTHLKHLKSSLDMINQEVRMTKPMVAKGVKSKVDFLKLRREANEIKERYTATKLSIPRLESAIKEAKNAIKETRFLYQNDAKTKLNEAMLEFKTLESDSTAYQDQVTRTLVKSPMKGIVQNLFINTLGGVIKPGADILEIVPSEQTLILEVKVKPSDIAFIYFGQKAVVKFSAYDFSIYGGLEGEVILISADTLKDQKENTFYTVQIKTDKNYIAYMNQKLKIIPGMTASVDIITGKKSVLDYILKPILKTKQYIFTER